MHRAKRLSAGRYLYRGRYILQTSWDGPNGGTRWRWELASRDEWKALIIDGNWSYTTLREAKAAVDEEHEKQSDVTVTVVPGPASPRLLELLFTDETKNVRSSET